MKAKKKSKPSATKKNRKTKSVVIKDKKINKKFIGKKTLKSDEIKVRRKKKIILDTKNNVNNNFEVEYKKELDSLKEKLKALEEKTYEKTVENKIEADTLLSRIKLLQNGKYKTIIKRLLSNSPETSYDFINNLPYTGSETAQRTRNMILAGIIFPKNYADNVGPCTIDTKKVRRNKLLAGLTPPYNPNNLTLAQRLQILTSITKIHEILNADKISKKTWFNSRVDKDNITDDKLFKSDGTFDNKNIADKFGVTEQELNIQEIDLNFKNNDRKNKKSYGEPKFYEDYCNNQNKEIKSNKIEKIKVPLQDINYKKNTTLQDRIVDIKSGKKIEEIEYIVNHILKNEGLFTEFKLPKKRKTINDNSKKLIIPVESKSGIGDVSLFKDMDDIFSGKSPIESQDYFLNFIEKKDISEIYNQESEESENIIPSYMNNEKYDELIKELKESTEEFKEIETLPKFNGDTIAKLVESVKEEFKKEQEELTSKYLQKFEQLIIETNKI